MISYTYRISKNKKTLLVRESFNELKIISSRFIQYLLYDMCLKLSCRKKKCLQRVTKDVKLIKNNNFIFSLMSLVTIKAKVP